MISANVPVVVFGVVGSSHGNNMYNRGPRTLPWGISEFMAGTSLPVETLNSIEKKNNDLFCVF